MTKSKESLLEHLLGNRFERNIERSSGWTKSPSRAFFFEVYDVIQKANKSHQLQNPNFSVDNIFNVGSFMKEIASCLTTATIPPNRAIVWRTTPSKMNRHIGEAIVVDIQDPFLSTSGEASRNVQQRRNQYFGYLLNQAEQVILKEKCSRDNFGINVTSTGEKTTTALSTILLRIFLHHVEKHMRQNNGAVENLKTKNCLQILLGSNELDWKHFHDSTEKAESFLIQHVEKLFKGKKKERSTFKLSNIQLGKEKLGPFITFMKKDNRISRWNAMISCSPDDWEGIEVGNIPQFQVDGVQYDGSTFIIPLHDFDQFAERQKIYCSEGNWIEALNLYTKEGTISIEFMDFLLLARKTWQECRLLYVVQGRHDKANEIRMKISPFFPLANKHPWNRRSDVEFLQKLFNL